MNQDSNASKSGFLVVDKPCRLSSRQAVDRLVRDFGDQKLGHAGTLDPLATGVLVIGVGNIATALIDQIHNMEKVYTCRVRLGATSDTDDVTGNLTEQLVTHIPTLAEVQGVLAKWQGEVMQIPPQHSAIRVNKNRAYRLAREGQKLELPQRIVRIDAIRILQYQFPILDIEVLCGKGTYIRSLARDVGEALGCGGLVAVLRRERIGPFLASAAMPWDHEHPEEFLLPHSMALGQSNTFVCNAQQIEDIRHGRRPLLHTPDHSDLITLNPQGEVIALGKVETGRYYLKRVFIR